MLLFAMILINPLLSMFVPVTTILRSMELLCYIGIFFYLNKLRKHGNLRHFDLYEQFLYIMLLFITVGILVRGEWPNTPKDFALHLLVTPTYLLPFIIVLLPNVRHFDYIVHLFFRVSLWIVPIWLLNLSSLVQVSYKAESIGVALPFLSAFLLGINNRFTKRQQWISLIIWAIYFFLMMLNARRNTSFTLLLYAFIAYMFLVSSSVKRHKLKAIFLIFVSIISGLMLCLNFESLTSGLFRSMADRVMEDTRSGVEELFFLDFANAPKTDWIFGRGMDGGYYQIMVNEETCEINDNRTAIETGYLNMMLKGGLVYDVVIVLIMLLAIKRGYSRRNRMCLFLTTILLTYFIDLYTTNPVCAFSVRSILFWFCISVLSNNVPILKLSQLIRNGKRS